MFSFKLENEDGTPAEPATLHTTRTELEPRRRHHLAWAREGHSARCGSSARERAAR
jgi:hypothetical protein